MNRIEPITADIISAFVPLMNDEDRAELGHDPEQLVAHVWRGSVHSFAGVVDGNPAFIGGVNQRGCVWMISTPLVAQAKKFYLRATKAEAMKMQALFPTIWTWVDSRYTKSLRWLDWLGFDIADGAAVPGTSRIIHRVERRA